MAIQPIRIVIQGIDKFSSTIGQSTKKIQKFGKDVSQVGRKMTMGLTIPIIALGAQVVNTTTNFEKSMNKVEALTQATTEDMLKMRDAAKSLGITTQFSASEAADAMGFLGMAGWKTNQILLGTPHLLDLAAASQTDLARTADIASNIMGAFRIEAKDTGMVADLLAATTASSNVNLEMLAETFKDAGPIAHAAGVGIRDISTAIGFLGNIGIQGTKSGTALKNMFTRLASPESKAAKILKHFNVVTEDSMGNLRPYADILTDLSGKMADLGTAEKLKVLDAIFGKRVIAGAAALTEDITKVNSGFRDLSNALSNTDGRAKKMAETMLKGAPGAFKKFTSAWEGMVIAIGESGLVEAIAGILTKLTGLIRKIADTNPEILKMATIFGAIVAAIGPLLMIIGPIISGFGALMGAIASAGGVIALLSNPIGWIIGGILALVGAIVLMKKKFGMSIKSMISGMLAFAGPIGWIAILFIKNWSKMLPFIKLIGLAFVGLGKILMYALWPVFKAFEFWGEQLEWITGMVLDLFSALTRLVLPKWLEEKIGLTPAGDTTQGGTNLSADEIAGRSNIVNKNVNENKLIIEDRAGVNIKPDEQNGILDTEVLRGLGFQN
jgi:TP901 family phage tail tape measure protein